MIYIIFIAFALISFAVQKAYSTDLKNTLKSLFRTDLQEEI